MAGFRSIPSALFASFLMAGLFSSALVHAQDPCRYLAGSARTFCNQNTATRSAQNQTSVGASRRAPNVINAPEETTAQQSAYVPKPHSQQIAPAQDAMQFEIAKGGLDVAVSGRYPEGYRPSWALNAATPQPIVANRYNHLVKYGRQDTETLFVRITDDQGRAALEFSRRGSAPCLADIVGLPQVITSTPQEFLLDNFRYASHQGPQCQRTVQSVEPWEGSITLSSNPNGDLKLSLALYLANRSGAPWLDFIAQDLPFPNRMTPQMAVVDMERKGQTQASARSMTMTNGQGAAPAVRANPVAASTGRMATATPQDPDSYDSKSFSGLSTWVDAFGKEASNPAEFAANLAKIKATANGAQAKMQTLPIGAQRNHFQKFLSDHKLYKGYYPSAAKLLARQNQCLEQRPYSAAETCDCVAGFPGDTAIGPGAGELVIRSNKTKAIAACGRAAELATEPRLKARFTAQRARAEAYGMDGPLAVKSTDEALAGGYRRAIIVKATIGLNGVEVLSSGFPVLRSQVEGELKFGVEGLKAAKKAGVWETFIVAEQFQQALANLAFSDAVLEPILKSMLTPPPKSQCGPDSIGSDGKPIAGSGCGIDYNR